MRFQKFVTILLLLVTALLMVQQGKAQEDKAYLCSGTVPIDSVSDTAPFSLKDLVFFGLVDSSAGHVELVNNSTKTIEHYLVIIDLFDSAGEYILSIPIFNVDKGQKIPFDVNLEPWIMANWPGGYFEGIDPKASARKTFFAPFTVLTCPARARISMIRLRYQNNTEYEFSAVPVRTMPILTEASFKDPASFQKWMPLAVSGTIQVDSTGKAHVATIDFQEPEFKTWLQGQISDWRFFPASLDGKSRSGEISFLFMIGDTKDAKGHLNMIREKGMSRTVLVVAAIPPTSSFSRTWVLVVGSQPKMPE